MWAIVKANKRACGILALTAFACGVLFCLLGSFLWLVYEVDQGIPGGTETFHIPDQFRVTVFLKAEAGANPKEEGLAVERQVLFDKEIVRQAGPLYVRDDIVLLPDEGRGHYVMGHRKGRLGDWGVGQIFVPLRNLTPGRWRAALRYEIWRGSPGWGMLLAKGTVLSESIAVKEADGTVHILPAKPQMWQTGEPSIGAPEGFVKVGEE
jgi:hypothetical protein